MISLLKSIKQYCLAKNYVNLYSNRRFLTGLNLWHEEISSEIKHKLENHWKSSIVAPCVSPDDNREKYYVLSMFPYPSGYLHMGHVRVYTISDTIARFQRMNGKNVIHPIGWDAFGLPAENAAIERQKAPEEWTKQNISHMKEQLKKLGCSFEWERELATCDPRYYKWTQDLFLKLFEAGLVYRKEALVNWDPVDQTVLADEQVDENGLSWRSGAKVEKKLLKQWFIKTTNFAKDLLEGLDDPILYEWRDIIKLQKHWIGDCNGVSFDFKTTEGGDVVTVWTSKPEFIEHAKFFAVTSEHILAKKQGACKGAPIKLNVDLINPFNQEKIPVYLTNEIEFLPLTDCHLGIPGASDSDSIFAQNHNINYTELSHDQTQAKQQEICAIAQKQNIGGHWTSAKLRDWLISRQRYWGTPIPIVHCPNCGPQAVPREQLPIELPKLVKLSQKGGSQLGELDWCKTSCPKCQGHATRETDTMDTFVDSSWYYLRYLDVENEREMVSGEKARRFTPVDLYIGGKEHAVLHLYYARFISHFLHSLGLLPHREPFKRLLVQGMVMGRSYRIKGSGKYLPETEVEILDLKRNKAQAKATGEPVVIAWEKMSKSKYNGVDPDDMFKEFGTDTTRLLMLADVAPISHRNWSRHTFPGVLNWQKRMWLTIGEFLNHRNNPPASLPEAQFKSHDDFMFDSRNFYIKGATFHYLYTQQLSIAVSKQQGLTNSIRKVPPAIFAHSKQFERALAAQIILLAPMAPHLASELWSGFVSAPNRLDSTEILWDKTVLEQPWPETDMDYKLDLVCKVNSTEHCNVKISRRDLEKLSESDAVKLALDQPEIQKGLGTKQISNTNFRLYKACEGVVTLFARSASEEQKVAASLF